MYKTRTAKIAVALMLVSSLLLLCQTASAYQPQPAVPEFTVKFVDYSYDIPPTYGTDPYNGQTIVTHPGDHVYNKTLEITIQNQPFTLSEDINLYYNVRIKGGYEQSWRELFGVHCIGMTSEAGNYRIQNYGAQTTFIRYTLPWDTPNSGVIDVQVKAMAGKPIVSANGRILFSEYSYSFDGVVSPWSNTQTVTFGNAAPPPSQPTSTATPTTTPAPIPTQNPTAEPTQPSMAVDSPFNVDCQGIVFAVLAVTIALLVGIIAFMRRRIQVLERKHVFN